MNTDALEKMINDLQVEILTIHESIGNIDDALKRIVYITQEIVGESRQSD